MITFYGHLSGHSSYPTVCQAITEYLTVQKFDLRTVDLRSIVKPQPCRDKGVGVKLLFGFPEWHTVTPKHEVNIGYHVCDVDMVPDQWVSVMNREDLVLTPSVWCKQVFERCGVKTPITVVPHGVHRVFKPVPLEPPFFSFLHFCSSKDPSRKGTLELIEAYEQVTEAMPDAFLQIVTASPIVLERIARSAARWRIEEVPEAFVMPVDQAARYQRAAVVAVPSRAEGFGMIGLEALACGVPVIGTRVTGHKEWFGRYKGTVEVKTHHMDFCGGPGRAPVIDVHDLSQALLYSYKGWDILRKEAKNAACQVQREFAWPTVLRLLAEILEGAEASALS